VDGRIMTVNVMSEKIIDLEDGIKLHTIAHSYMMEVNAYEYKDEPFTKNEVKVTTRFNDDWYDPEDLMDELRTVADNIQEWLSKEEKEIEEKICGEAVIRSLFEEEE
jgi:hypothetical protein